MLEKIQKKIDAYIYIRDRASQKCAELKHKKDRELHSYWAGVLNCANLIIKDLENLRTEFEMLDNNLDIDLSKLRGK